MALTNLGGNSSSNSNRTKPSQEEINERRQQRENNRRTRSEEDRDTTNEAVTNIRAATANRFGTTTNPSRALTALEKYTRVYMDARTKNITSGGESYHTVIVEKGVAVPSVVILQKNVTEDSVLWIGHAIMLVDYKVKPASIDHIVNSGIRYNHNTVWADAMDETYIERISEEIQRQLQVDDVNYLAAGCTTIQVDFIPTEKMLNEASFQSQPIDNLLFWTLTGIDAIRTIESEDNSRAISPEVVNPDATILADISLAPSTTHTVGGLPIAEDFLIRLSEVTDDRGRRDRDRDRGRSLNDTNADASKTYGAVSGRIDFQLWDPIESSGRNPRLEDSACNLPEFIISNVDVGDQAVTLPMLIQLFMSVGVLDTRKPRIFLEAFDPRNIANNPSRNLGALNAYVQDPEDGRAQERFNTLAAGNEPELFRKFTKAAIIDGSRVGLEIPSQGPLVAILSYFERAVEYALGDGKAREWNDHIIHACNILTDYAFEGEWKDTDPVMLAERHIIPTGYWIDDQQQLRDSRELGFLYYANLENPREASEMAMAYFESFLEEDQLIAAQERLKLITDVKGSNFVQTDNVARVYFNADFYSAVNRAMRSVNLGISTPNTKYIGRGNERRRIDDGAQYGVMDRRRLEQDYGRYSGRDRERSRGRGYSGRGYNR